MNIPAVKTYTPEELRQKPWRTAVHKPTQISYWVVDESGLIPTPGDTHNLNAVKGMVVATDGVRMWLVEGKFEDLYSDLEAPPG